MKSSTGSDGVEFATNNATQYVNYLGDEDSGTEAQPGQYRDEDLYTVANANEDGKQCGE